MALLRLSLLRFALALALLALGAGASAQTGTAIERQVKAAYLYKFAGFVEWPDNAYARPDSPLVIGVAGNDALADQVEQTVAGRSANGRAVTVRRIHRGDSLAGLQMLFIGDRGAAQEYLNASRGLPLLTVTDSDEAYAAGSMINFVVTEDKLRFEVSLKQVAQGRLHISARMLAAAYKVQQVSS